MNAYYKQAKNLIDEGQFGAPIILSAFNYRTGQASGIELSTSYDRGPWSLYGNVAYSRAVGKDIVSSQFNFAQADLDYISQHYVHFDHDQRWTGSGGAAYTLYKDTNFPARLSADLIVGSGLRADGAVPNGRALPGYYTVNLSAVQTIKTGVMGPTQLRLDVINLLDRRYELRDGTGVGVGAPQFGLRRTILAGLGPAVLNPLIVRRCNDGTVREAIWRRYAGDEWAAFDQLLPAIRLRLTEHAYDVWSVNQCFHAVAPLPPTALLGEPSRA